MEEWVCKVYPVANKVVTKKVGGRNVKLIGI